MPQRTSAGPDVPSGGPSALLAVSAAVALMLCLTTGYINRAVLDPAHFAHRASAALDDAAVRSKVASAVSDAVNGSTSGAVPADQVNKAVDAVVSDPSFARQFRDAVVKVHSALVENGADNATLVLAGIGPLVTKQIQAAQPGVPLPASLPPIRLSITPPSAVSGTVHALHSLRWVPTVLGLVALALFAVLLVTARDRTRALRRAALATLAAGGVMVAVYFLLREVVVNSTGDAGVAGGIFGAYFSDFAIASVILAGAGALGWWGAARLAASSRSEPVVAAGAGRSRPASTRGPGRAASRVRPDPPPARTDETRTEAATTQVTAPVTDHADVHRVPPLPATQSDRASRREPVPERSTKTCPDCAETVLAAARVCKHCGYRFDPLP